MAIQSDRFLLPTRYITDLLREFHAYPSTKIDAFALDPADMPDGSKGYQLTVFLDGRSSMTFFSEEVLKNYGSKGWEKRIRKRMKAFLRGSDDTKVGS